MTSRIQVGGISLTREQAENAGLLPEQRAERHSRQAKLLERLGMTDRPEYSALLRGAEAAGTQARIDRQRANLSEDEARQAVALIFPNSEMDRFDGTWAFVRMSDGSVQTAHRSDLRFALGSIR